VGRLLCHSTKGEEDKRSFSQRHRELKAKGRNKNPAGVKKGGGPGGTKGLMAGDTKSEK